MAYTVPVPVSAFKAAVAIALVTATCACTTYSLSDGQKLAAAGKTLASGMRDEAGATSDEYRLNAQRSALLSVLARAQNPAVEVSVNAPDVADFERIATVLATRKVMLDSLVDLYSSLEAGMSYDAASETSTAFNSFLTNVDAYRKAVDPQSSPVATTSQASGIGTIVGIFAGYIQRRKMLQASRVVREQLPDVIAALRKEEELHLSAKLSTSLLKHRLTDALRTSGLATPTSEIDGMVALAGTARASDAEKIYRTNERLQIAVNKYNRWSDENYEPQLIRSKYNSMIDGFDDLQKQHARFETGKPMDLSSLVEDAEKIRAISLLLEGKSQ